MKRSAKASHPQMNLPLNHVPATAAAGDGQQNELTIALMELLISAAEQEENEQSENGGEHESEAYA
jgi:hypothetical protein